MHDIGIKHQQAAGFWNRTVMHDIGIEHQQAAGFWYSRAHCKVYRSNLWLLVRRA
jgi:hypothetical protein